MMKKVLLWISFVLLTATMQAAVYHLEKVNSIISGEKYVLVDATCQCAMSANGGSNALNPIFEYKQKDLVGTEEYVWTMNDYPKNPGCYQMVCYASTQLSASGGKLATMSGVGAAGSKWQFAFQASDSAATVSAKGGDTYYIYFHTPSPYCFQVKQSKPSNNMLIYHLVADTYDREATVGQISTICLPYAVDKVTGADVYQMSYLEKDQAGNPYKLYYEEVEGDLTAGRPYLFVPTATKVSFQKKNTTTESQPQYFSDGFYGTFDAIQDGEPGAAGNQLENNYMVYNNTFQKCGGNCSLAANRAYIKMDQVPTAKPNQVASRRTLSISQSGVEYFDATQLGSISKEENKCVVQKVLVNGQLMIIRNNQSYTIQGLQR